MHPFHWGKSLTCGPGSIFHGPWGFLFNLMCWGLVIAVSVWIVRVVMRRDNSPETSWLEVLRKRYASGEINREEFERIKGDLR